ncbi:hypothetical protein ACFX2H_008864 [Malus domestica]
MGPIIWYLEPRCASMGKRSASVPVADVSKAVHDRRFSQQQIITQLQNFRDKVTMTNHQLTDLQHSLADLAILSARQEQFQQTCLEELRSLKTQPTTLPQPTWSTSPPQPITTFHPSRTPFAAGTSSPSPTTPPFHSSSHPVCHFPTSRYLPQSSSGSVFHPFDSDPHSFHHYPPPSPTHDPHFTHAYSTPPHSPMTIPAPDLPGPTTSTLAVLEFTTASLEPTLHPVSLDKQVQRVTESVSSLRVCQDRLQTQPTEGADGLESQLEGLDSTLGLNPSRALESTPSNPYPRPLIYSTPLTSIPHLESVTKAPCSLSTVLIPSILPGIGSSPTVSLQTTPHLPSQIPSSTPPQLRHHRVPPLPSTSPSLAAMATSSRTRASVTVESSRTTTRSGHASTQIKRSLQPISSVAMKRKPKSEVFGYRRSKNSSNFSSSSVGSTLCSYCCTDGIVHTVLIHDVTSSRWKSGSQTNCNGSRVMPPLGNPTHAIEDLFPKEDFIQIAHRVPRPKEPDKALCCQVPILYSPLQQARLHLEFIPHYMTFAMIVFNSYGSRRNILAHDVFDKRQKRAIDQNYVPHIFFLIRNVPRAIALIWGFQTIFFTGTFGWVSLCFVDSFDLNELYNQYIHTKFGEPIEYSAYLDTISQPQKIPHKLKSSRQYRAYMETLLAYLIHFFQRPEPLPDRDRIFLKVEPEIEEQWAPGKVKEWENEKQANGHVQDQLTMLDLDYSSTGEELMAVGPEKLKDALALLGLQTSGTVQRAVETTLGSPITLLTGTFARGSVLSSNLFVVVLSQDHMIGRAVPGSMVAVTTTTGHPMVAGTPTRADNAYADIDAIADQIQLLMVIFYSLLHCIIHHDPTLELFRHSRDAKTLEAIEFGLYACSVQPTKQLITVVEDTCCLGPQIIQRPHGTKAYMYCDGLTTIVEKPRCGEHIWHVDCKVLQLYCKLIIIPMATYLNAKSNLEFLAPPFVTSVCGSYDFESYFPEYLRLFKALLALHFQWYHVFATVVSMSMVLTAPRALALLSNDSESVFCQVFFGFVPLGSLAFTVVTDSQQLELNVKVEKLLENQISLFTDYISELSWIIVATREFLTWHHSVSFSIFHQWPAIFSTSSRSFGSLGLLFGKNWLYYMLAGLVVYLEIHTALVLGASIMVIVLAPHGLGEQAAAPASACQLDGLRTCLILRGREC